MSAGPIEAVYFDGKTSEPQRVFISQSGAALKLEGTDWAHTLPRDALRLSEPLGGAPRLIYLPEGGYCEVRDRAGFDALLCSLGTPEAAVSRWGRSTRLALGAVLAIVLAGWVGFQFGIPWAADRLAHAMPTGLATQLGRGVLEALDQTLFAPSTLAAARQQALRERYAELASAPGPILFRSSPKLGANALALPDSTIVLTDELVRVAGNDQEIMAVIAHEAGHIVHRDHLRAIIQSTLVSTIVTLWLGDVNFMIAAVPAALLNARYSREVELAADDHAAGILKRNGLNPELLGRLLERLEADRHRGAGQRERQGLLDTHPLTRERMERMRAAATSHDR